MALSKRTYVDGETIITAQNLNDIQDEVRGNIRNVSYNTTSGKIQKTTNSGTSSDVLTVDATPTQNSKNPVQSGGVYTEIDDLNTAITNKLPTTNVTELNISSLGNAIIPVRDTATNKPSDASGRYGAVWHYASSSNYATQIYQETGTGKLWIRAKVNGTWDDWHRIFNDVVTQGTATPASTLPSGVTSVDVKYVKCGQVVTVYLVIARNSTSITSYTTVASGLPIPAVVLTTSGGSNYPLALITVAGTQGQRPMQVYVNSSGSLRINYGNAEGNYLGAFTYITSDV